MKASLFSCLGVLALSASLLSAQPGTTSTPPTLPTPAEMVANQVARLTKLLSLTTGQQSQATTIFTTEQTNLTTVRASMKTAHDSLQTAIKANDQASIASLSAQLGTLTGQQIQAQSVAYAAFYAILTADQQTKFSQMPMGGFGGGMGGPGGPGGGGPRGRMRPPQPEQ